ncbi:MAG: type II secretion system F family protein [Nitriliruptoraceae bacterium]
MVSSSSRAGDPRALDRLRVEVAAGTPLTDIAGLPERCRCALELATVVGAPLLPAVDAAREAQDDVEQARRAVAVASAQTRVVAGGLVIAPLVLVPGLGRLVGVDLVAFYSTGIGLVVLGTGLGLLALGAGMVLALVRRVDRARRRGGSAGMSARLPMLIAVAVGVLVWGTVGAALAPLAALGAHQLAARRINRGGEPVTGVDEAADLVATALAGGVGAPEALRLAADRLPELAIRLRRLAFGLELGMVDEPLPAGSDRSAPPGVDPLHRLAQIITTADRTGAPVAPSLRHLARDLRADDLARVLAAAERLPAQLTFPTALCLLPATVLLVGAPIVQAGLATAGT